MSAERKKSLSSGAGHDGHESKRRKVSSANNDRPASKSVKRNDVGQMVSLDELQWRTVPLPDRMEDVEGFFGLEEIDDIDVLRDAEKGTLQYQVASKPAAKRPKKQVTAPTKHERKRDEVLLEPNEKNLEEGYEWEGFADTSQAEGSRGIPRLSLDETDLPSREEQKAGKVKKKAQKRSKDASADQGAQKSPTNAFAGLEEESEEIGVDVSAWKPLKLFPQTLSSISKLGFSRPTEIQSAAIPPIIEDHDVIGKAPTGSGKTLAYGIPILEHYLQTRSPDSQDSAEVQIPVALIVSPTRELAHQLAEHLTALCSNISSGSPKVATLTGGLSVQKQRRLLEKADIIIGTPGRLWEVISSGQGIAGWLKKIKFLVIDEADRLLNEGHFKEFEEIINILDREDEAQDASDSESEVDGTSGVQRQTLVFSATFHKGLQQKLAGKGRPGGGDLMDKKESMEYLLKKLNFREQRPKFIDVNPISQMAEGLREGLVECAALEKDLYLYSLLLLHPGARTLVFTNSISSVRRLVPLLQNLNISAHGLHSSMPQKARLRSLERFAQAAPPANSPSAKASTSSNAATVLIATDVAARGLDIPNVQLIIHYHLPRAADAYVHRSGRTARASNEGTSILLCAPEEVVGVRRLVAKVHADAGLAPPSSSDAQDGSTRQGQRSLYKNSMLPSIDLDRRLVSRLKSRLNLAKHIADSTIAKEKRGREDDWLRNAAEELGVEYDSDEFAATGAASSRGGGKNGTKKRKEREQEARALSKADVAALKAQLRELLSQRVNVGISERYLTGNGARVDMAELLRSGAGRAAGGTSAGEFLGRVEGLEGLE